MAKTEEQLHPKVVEALERLGEDADRYEELGRHAEAKALRYAIAVVGGEVDDEEDDGAGADQ